MELTDRTSVTEAQVHKIGMIAIPAGAGANAGKPFAACFLEIVAKVAREELDSVYSMLLKSPALVPLLGEFDYEFENLTGSTAAVRQWVEKRLHKSFR
jgi:hypothetical protein